MKQMDSFNEGGILSKRRRAPLSILVKLYVQYLVIATRDAGMPTLMVLVAIFPANISQRPVLVYRHLVYEAYAQALPFEATGGLGLVRGLPLQHETIFSSHDISLLRFLLGSLESHHHAIARYEIFMLGQSVSRR